MVEKNCMFKIIIAGFGFSVYNSDELFEIIVHWRAADFWEGRVIYRA